MELRGRLGFALMVCGNLVALSWLSPAARASIIPISSSYTLIGTNAPDNFTANAAVKSRRSPRSSSASRKSPAAISRAGSFATSRFFSSTILSKIFATNLWTELTEVTEFKISIRSIL